MLPILEADGVPVVANLFGEFADANREVQGLAEVPERELLLDALRPD